MGLDIRLPIGSFFALIGVILAAYGMLSDPSIYQRSLGIDVNTFWGLLLVVFGVAMFLFGRRAASGKKAPRKNPRE
jgi:multisubunit Na+/H+ antiporter MnhG subunit